MAGYYLSVAVWFSAACLLKESSAAISPSDETYNVTAGDSIFIPWTYDNAASMTQIFWTYKSSAAAATATTIMSKIGAANAQVFNNFNVMHVTTNGENGKIQLQTVTMDKNQGVYYCQVSYTLLSGLGTVTATATLSVTAATTTTSTISTTTSTTTTTTTPANTTTTTTTTTTSPANTTTTTPTTMTTPTTTKTPSSTTTTMPFTTTSLRMPITNSTPLITSSTFTSNSTSSTLSSNEGLSDEIIIIIVIVPVGLIAFVGTVIFFCLFYRLQREKRKPASHERLKQRKHYKGNRSVQQQQQQPYILYGRGRTRRSNHKETKRLRSLHNDDKYNLYDWYHWGSQVKRNPVYKGDKNLDRLYYNESLPRYDDYKSGYTKGHVYPSHASGYQYRRDYHGDSRGHGNRQQSSYPVYSTQQEYIDHSYSYMGY